MDNGEAKGKSDALWMLYLGAILAAGGKHSREELFGYIFNADAKPELCKVLDAIRLADATDDKSEAGKHAATVNEWVRAMGVQVSGSVLVSVGKHLKRTAVASDISGTLAQLRVAAATATSQEQYADLPEMLEAAAQRIRDRLL